MVSDERTQHALDALAQARAPFHAAVARTVDEVHALLGRLSNGRVQRQTAELGAFAAGRIDAERFGALATLPDVLEPAALDVVRRCLAALEEIARWSEAGFLVRVPTGHDIRGEVAAALGVAGRAFGAARAVELVRTRRFIADHGYLLAPFAPHRWSRAERMLAPPLVVEVDGGDLHAGALAEFMDGAQKLVLVVRAPAPPAALVRLVTPGVLVAQVEDAGAVAALLPFDGPAAIALVPDGAAHFVHDPRAGDSIAARLTVGRMIEEEPRGTLGRLTALQRAEELHQLRALAEAARAGASATGPTADAAAAAAPPADRLAAWLLRQSGLEA